MDMRTIWVRASLITFFMGGLEASASYLSDGFKEAPAAWQARQAVEQMQHGSASVRAGAIEQLGFMRATAQAAMVAAAATDPDAAVRREAVMALGWLGNPDSIDPLLDALADDDWSVRQAAAVSLENLTAVDFSFDAMATPAERETQVVDWTQRFKANSTQELALAALSDAGMDFFEKADWLRAAGVFGCTDLVEPLIQALTPYIKGKYPADDKKLLYTPASPATPARPERAFVQAGLRTLGQLGGDEAEAFLINMLEQNTDWACYAAEALGDCGSSLSVTALIRAFPSFAFKLDHPDRFNRYTGIVPKFPRYDAPDKSCVDRIPRTAYEIMFALSRLDLSDHQNELAQMSPYLLTSVPNLWDSTVVYTEEPWAMLIGYLLDQARVRQQAVDASFAALKTGNRTVPDSFALKNKFMKLASRNLGEIKVNYSPYAGEILLACAQSGDVPLLLELLAHPNGWIRMEAAEALMRLDAQEAVAPMITLLEQAQDDADYGYGMVFSRLIRTRVKWPKGAPREDGYDELNDPSPRFKQGYIRALGGLKAESAVPVLVRYLNNERNANEIQYAAAQALGEIASPAALDALREAEVHHPVQVVQVTAREALWKHSVDQIAAPEEDSFPALPQQKIPTGLPKKLVFIKGEREPGNNEQISKDMTAYSSTDGGPTYRLGRNVFTVETVDPDTLKQLTYFTSGYVADLEVSYDGKKVLFTHNTLDPEPWFHVYEMNADGSGLTQLTFGPYHDVHPNYLPDGRIVLTSSRTGIRDEYHGYPANGLAVMNADGSNLQILGINIGRDAEPAVGDDGKILFTRLELFYSRMKTEWNLLATYPDGRNMVTLYGPERRDFHVKIGGADAIAPPRHRGIRITQPQSWGRATYLVNTFKGPLVVGPGHYQERLIMPNNDWAVTSPVKVNENTLLVAAGQRARCKKDDSKGRYKAGDPDVMASVDHGLYWLDANTGDLTLIYNDPNQADFEARPLQPRKVPPVLPDSPLTQSRAYSGTIYCSSAFITQDPHVKERGKYIRVVEGIPTVTRHQTHTSKSTAWRNHGGALGRVFGTTPLAADGSFSLELPSDRLFHFQVLDSDRRVVGNELIWQSVRPKETKGCVGCHENPDATPSLANFPLAQKSAPVKCLPYGNEMQYHAKMWTKGWAPDEREERMRTVNSINILGRN